MTLVLLAAIVTFPLFTSPSAQAAQRVPAGVAQAQNTDSVATESHVITVSRSGEAYAKPDLGILAMSIQSSSAIADEAVAANAQKAMAVEAALKGLGFATGDYQITSVAFGQAGGGGITGYNVTQYLYVFFAAPDLNDVAKLTQRSADVLEAMRKAGAASVSAGAQFGPQFSPGFAGGAVSPIIYTIKDAAQYEHQALQVAIARARDAAQDVATGTGVQIVGLRSVQSGYLGGNVMPRTGTSALAGLKYRWYSSKSDELAIIANATVQYDFK